MPAQPSLFPPPRRRSGRARRGLDLTLKCLRDSGRLEGVDEAWVALARVAADELDAACADLDESRYTRGVLIARHLAVLDRLAARPDTAAAADLEALFADALAAEGAGPSGTDERHTRPDAADAI